MPHYLMQLYCITIFKDKIGCYMASSVHNDNGVIMEKDYDGQNERRVRQLHKCAWRGTEKKNDQELRVRSGVRNGKESQCCHSLIFLL